MPNNSTLQIPIWMCRGHPQESKGGELKQSKGGELKQSKGGKNVITTGIMRSTVTWGIYTGRSGLTKHVFYMEHGRKHGRNAEM
jgi:hypothetical protein